MTGTNRNLVLLPILCSILLGVYGSSINAKTATEVSGFSQIHEFYLQQREWLNRLLPFTLPYSPDTIIQSISYNDYSFQDSMTWLYHYTSGPIVLSADLSKVISETQLGVYENIKYGLIFIINPFGEVLASFNAPPIEYYDDPYWELHKRCIVMWFPLAQPSISESALENNRASSDEEILTSLRSSTSYPTDRIWLEIRRDVPNPTEFASLYVHVPTNSVTNLDVFAKSNLLSQDDWLLLISSMSVNEQGILSFTNVISTVTNRFYLAVNADSDTDGDGIPDGRERFVYHTSPTSADTDGDGLPDGWELQYGLDPLDNDSTNSVNGADGDVDGDGFSNLNEYLLNGDPNDSAWSGEQLCDRIVNASASRSSGSRSSGMRVNIADSANCGGSNSESQIQEAQLTVPSLRDAAYLINMTVQGAVEDQASGYDKVSVETCEEIEFFQGNANGNQCAMAHKSITLPILVQGNSIIILRYDTVDGFFHSGAYAEITGASLLGAIKIDSTTVATTPSDRTRKTIGVGEEVSLSFLPGNLSPVTWTLQGSGTLSSYSGNQVVFTAPDSASTATIEASYKCVTCPITFTVVEPASQSATIFGATYSYPPGVQGAGMFLEVTVHPTNVSFEKVEIMEVPGPATSRTGFYTNFPAGCPMHTTNPNWVPLDPGNIWYDDAYFTGEPAPWSAGSFEWDIPVQWHVVGSVTVGSLPNVIQAFSISGTNGCSAVSKLGQSATRTP